MAPKLEAVDTTGRAKFALWMATRSQSSVARILGVAQPSVRAWLIGLNRPTDPHRQALEKVAGIPAGDWRTAEENALEVLGSTEDPVQVAATLFDARRARGRRAGDALFDATRIAQSGDADAEPRVCALLEEVASDLAEGDC